MGFRGGEVDGLIYVPSATSCRLYMILDVTCMVIERLKLKDDVWVRDVIEGRLRI